VPAYDKNDPHPKGTKDLLNEMGREKFVEYIKNSEQIYYTDTTLRDAHQSLFATRLRNHDMMKVVEGMSKTFPQLFSLEVWGGATFDVCMRFLHEEPRGRFSAIRALAPNVLHRMLSRGRNAVGIAAFPDNLMEEVIE